jgi:hypothetical protein
LKLTLLSALPAWRAFLGEVGVIVLGVLIALGIGEVADGLRWDARAKDTVRSIRAEWAQNGGVFEERVFVQPCLDRRLAELKSIVRAARQSGRIPNLSEIGRLPVRPLATDSWKQVTSSEVLLHIDAEQGRNFAAGYSQVERYATSVLVESDMWASLRMLEGNPGRISETLIAAAETTLAGLENKNYQNSIVAKQEFASGRSLGIPTSYFLLLDREGTRADAFRHLRDRAICKPLLVDGKSFANQT